jgi:hypothetical protein
MTEVCNCHGAMQKRGRSSAQQKRRVLLLIFRCEDQRIHPLIKELDVYRRMSVSYLQLYVHGICPFFAFHAIAAAVVTFVGEA